MYYGPVAVQGRRLEEIRRIGEQRDRERLHSPVEDDREQPADGERPVGEADLPVKERLGRFDAKRLRIPIPQQEVTDPAE